MIWAALIPVIGQLLDKVIPDPQKAAEAKQKLAELSQAQDMAYLDADVKLALGQMSVNVEEAKSANLFVSGWRPAAGWVCVSGLVYQFIVQPLDAWLSAIVGWPVPPVIDTGTLMTLLFGMLGLGGYRTFEKLKGVSGNHK